MNAEELRVGNVVWAKDRKLAYVDAVNKQTGEVCLFHNQSYHSCGLDDVKPVTINQKWLDRIGFDGATYEKYALLKNGHFLDLRFGEPIAENIKYLHQLQNIYYSVSGKELPIKGNLSDVDSKN